MYFRPLPAPLEQSPEKSRQKTYSDPMQTGPPTAVVVEVVPASSDGSARAATEGPQKNCLVDMTAAPFSLAVDLAPLVQKNAFPLARELLVVEDAVIHEAPYLMPSFELRSANMEAEERLSPTRQELDQPTFQVEARPSHELAWELVEVEVSVREPDASAEAVMTTQCCPLTPAKVVLAPIVQAAAAAKVLMTTQCYPLARAKVVPAPIVAAAAAAAVPAVVHLDQICWRMLERGRQTASLDIPTIHARQKRPVELLWYQRRSHPSIRVGPNTQCPP